MPKHVLTPNQITILRALSGVVSSSDAARALGINRCTANFHMRGRAKTEMHSEISTEFADALAKNLLNAKAAGLDAMAKALRATADQIDSEKHTLTK